MKGNVASGFWLNVPRPSISAACCSGNCVIVSLHVSCAVGSKVFSTPTAEAVVEQPV